jgi:hypothetical protein
VRPLAADPRLFDLQRATAAQVRRFRYIPMESWLPAQRDPAAADPFSTRIQESFYRAQLSAQIALRAHRLLGTCSQMLRVKNKATQKMLNDKVLRPLRHYFP